MPRFSHALLVAGLFTLSAGALAQPPGPSPTGGPGARPLAAPETRADLKARLEARFDRVDANHDGKLDRADAEARRSQRIAQRFDRIDTDRNGAISKDEFAAAEARRPMGPPMAGRAIGPGRRMLFRRGGGRLHGPLPFTPPPGAPTAGRTDRKPGEGFAASGLTRSSFVDRGLARFDRLDTDHDGTISQAERDAARAALRNARGRPKLPPSPPTPSRSGQ